MLVLLARLLLAAVLGVAAVAKVARRADTEATLTDFGVRPELRRSIAVALPLVELAIAVALLPAASAAWAGVAATILLATFTFAVARVLRRGEQVDCNCFGALGASRISGWTLARNLGLLVLAGFVAGAGLSDPGPSAVAWIGGVSATAAVAILAGLALGAAALNFAFSWQLMKQNGRLLERLDALGDAAPAAASPDQPSTRLGEPMPGFELPDLDGRTVGLDELLDEGRGLLLVFTDPNCHACDPLLPEIGRRQREAGSHPRPVVISRGQPDANRAKVAEHGLDLVLLQEGFDLPKSVGVGGMPGAIVLDRDGRIASESAVGTEKVSALLAATAPPLRLTKVEASR